MLQAAVLYASNAPKKPSLNHSLTEYGGARPQRTLAVGTVNVLAVMVQFQTDNDSLTSGDGHFEMSPSDGLDAPPHDTSYFEQHLLFLKNYFSRVSGGKLSLNCVLLDSVITLPHQMKYYSPPKSGTTNPDNLGLLYQDAWHAADSVYGNFDFSNYQCFVIFHAGSGRDIDFSSQLGYDPRPYDLPSLYLSEQGLRNMFGSSYAGQAVDNGSFHIPNSILMPESEFYEIYDASGELMIDLKLGTNGLLAASFGSFLGLPDLFDTQTGATGIGRFGLMDGQAIFAYGGLFPPEPSAWEKYYLGWTDPLEVSPATLTSFRLYANETGKYSVMKIPISGSEYYLLENRERDAHHDGENLTVDYQGRITTLSFDDDTSYFDGQQVININGVVTDADEYDWALPGEIDNGKTYYGGILIWHIDESVIDEFISTDQINDDFSHKGVALMEAHGANEIGRFIQTILGSYYYDGTAFDFWFNSNPYPDYTNQFTPTSFPNSNSYSGADSHIYVTDFSSADSVMSFDVMVGDANVQVAPGFPKNIHGATISSSPTFAHVSPNGRLQLLANNGDSLYAFNLDGSSAGFDTTGFLSNVGGKFQPVVSTMNSKSNVMYALDDSVLYGLVDVDANHDGTADTLFTAHVPETGFVAGAPLLRLGSNLLCFSATDPYSWSTFTTDGRFVAYNTLTFPLQGNSLKKYLMPSTIAISLLPQFAAVDTGDFYFDTYSYGPALLSLSSPGHSGPVAWTMPSRGSPPPPHLALSYATLEGGSRPRLIDLTSKAANLVTVAYDSQAAFNYFPGDTLVAGPVVADLNGDGNRDVIFATRTKVYAVSFTGSTLDHFPISTVGSEALPADANSIVGSIVVADLDGDGKPELIFGTKGGSLYAFTGATGQIYPGFPLSVGEGLAGSPAVGSENGNLYLAAIGLDGYAYCWTFKNGGKILWGNLLYDNSHSNSIADTLQYSAPPSESSLMPPAQVYNWPNPVTNNLTKIHFYLSDNAQVSIDVYTFAGDRVASFRVSGAAGAANEVDWNTSAMQSGIYFARVEAVSSKERDVKIIKIAVVK